MKNYNIPIIIKKERWASELINVYLLPEGFFVELWKNVNDDTYEAWIGHEDIGIKELMFGMPIAQQSYDDFRSIVVANIEDDAEAFKERYM